MRSIRHFSLALLLVITTSSAFSQNITTPLQLNNYFASINDTLYAGGREWGAKLNTVFVSKAFDSLAPIRIKMETFIVRKQQELKAMKDIGGSEAFRQAMIEFLSFEAKMMREAFTPLERFDSKSSAEEIKTAINSLVKLAEQESTHLKKVNEAQNEFAAKNKFTIEKKDD